MRPDVKSVVLSFGAVIAMALIGTDIGKRTVEIEREQTARVAAEKARVAVEQEREAVREQLRIMQTERDTAVEARNQAEMQLAAKLAEEERIAAEKARAAQEARLAAERAAAAQAAEAARVAAAEAAAAKSSKKSKAS